MAHSSMHPKKLSAVCSVFFPPEQLFISSIENANGSTAGKTPGARALVSLESRWAPIATLKKVRPRIAPRPDLTGARGTSARAAISLYILPAVAPQDYQREPPARSLAAKFESHHRAALRSPSSAISGL